MHSTFGSDNQENPAQGKVTERVWKGLQGAGESKRLTSLQRAFPARSLVLGRHGSAHLGGSFEYWFPLDPFKMKRFGRAGDRADSTAHAAILIDLGRTGLIRKG